MLQIAMKARIWAMTAKWKKGGDSLSSEESSGARKRVRVGSEPFKPVCMDFCHCSKRMSRKRFV